MSKKGLRILVCCSACGKLKQMTPFEYKKNNTGNFYCNRECLKIGHSNNNSGKNNPMYGKKHTKEAFAKMTGKNHWNYGNRTAVLAKAICKDCKNTFTYNPKRGGDRTFCNIECKKSYNKKSRQIIKCAYCGENVSKIKCFDKKHAFCNRECYYKYRKYIYIQPSGEKSHWYKKKGEETPNWQGGKSLEIYPPEFDKYLKEEIRKRDNYLCQLCDSKDKKRELSVHHIDYNKNNSSPQNLVSLCVSCHSSTNGNSKNREFWKEHLKIYVKNKYYSSTTY